MKKNIFVQEVFFFLIFIGVILIVFYLYRQGKISFFRERNKSFRQKEIESRQIEIPFKEKEFSLSYQGIDPSKVVNIAFFEETEDWHGDATFDYVKFFEGKSSVFLGSRDNHKSVASLDIGEGFNFLDLVNFKMFLNLETDPANIGELKISFIGEREASYEFVFNNFSLGWNFLTLPASKFVVNGSSLGKTAIIKKVMFELTSRPNTNSVVLLDFLWGCETDDYLEAWNTNSEKILSLGKVEKEVGLQIVNFDSNLATIRRINSAKDFVFKVKFTPRKEGNFGLFLRGNLKSGFGYYLGLGGAGANDWQIYKTGNFNNDSHTITLSKGTVGNLKVELNKDYWLKGTLKGSSISFNLSIDGENFTELTSVSDNSFSSGGVGVFGNQGNIFLVDDIYFENKI